jgi:putative ABC transport system substrate-binding protein
MVRLRRAGGERVQRPNLRRPVVIAVIAALLAFVFPSSSPQGHPTRPHITVVLSRDIPPYRRTLSGLRKVLGSHDPAPTFEVIDLQGGDSSAGELQASIPDTGSNLVIAVGARAALKLKTRKTRGPVLLAGVSGPEVESLMAGARQMFGVLLQIPIEKQFETLKEVVPDARKVGVIHGRENRGSIQKARALAKRAGLTLVPAEVASIKEIPTTLATLLEQVDVLWALPDATVFSPEMAPYIILQTLRKRVPFMSFSQNFVKAGSLLSLYCDLEDVGKQAGQMALAAMHGVGGTRSRVVPPRTARLAINMRVAQVIGLRIPDAIRDRADVIYE